MVEEQKELLCKDVWDYVLVDDDTPIGGTAYIGETVGDFVDELHDLIGPSSKVKRLNNMLTGCGIKPVEIEGR